MAKGTPVGSKYLFGGNEILIYPDGSAHLTATGGLAGSTLNINKGLRILVEEALVPFNYALNSCTINPAKCLHLDDRKGSIQVGKDADLVVLEDNYDVLQTYCMGQPKLDSMHPPKQARTKEIANMKHPLQEMMDKRRQASAAASPLIAAPTSWSLRSRCAAPRSATSPS